MRSETALQTNTWIATSVRMMAISRARCHKLTMLIPLILALWMTGKKINRHGIRLWSKHPPCVYSCVTDTV